MFPPGPPSAPRGPIEVSNMAATSCTLTWKAPDSDGGKPIKQYVVEKRDAKRNTWAPVEMVRGGKSTSCDVTRLLEGAEYDFRVMAENEEGRSVALETKDKVVCRKSAGGHCSMY